MSTPIQITEKLVELDLSEVMEQLNASQTLTTNKVEEIQKRIKLLQDKESMMNEFIARTHGSLEGTDHKNFKLRGQLQNAIMRQLEALQYITDTIIKYENLIQSYNKQRMDIQNNKVSNYAKWKALNAGNASDEAFKEVIQKFEAAALQMKTLGVDTKSGELEPSLDPVINTKNDFEREIMTSTFEEGYKI